MSTIPFRVYPKADIEYSWDALAAKKRLQNWAKKVNGEIDFNKFKKAFTWYNSKKPDNIGSYKLPHHDVIGGRLKVVWRGVAAAMAALLGARGGVQIPATDRKGVYNHLKKSYAQFNKKVPKINLMDEEEVINWYKEKLDMTDEEIDRTMKYL